MAFDPLEPEDDDTPPVTMSQRLRIEGINQQQQLIDTGRHLEKSVFWKFAVAVGGVCSVVMIGYVAMRAEVLSAAEKRADAGTLVLTEQVKSLKLKADRTEDRVERVEKIVEAMARRMKVEVPEPLRDGGPR